MSFFCLQNPKFPYIILPKICNFYLRFHDFHSPPLDDADFDAKPMILLVGQYSTGKTTFIKYLLEQEFPGMRIGPEPTTDCFIIITKVKTESNTAYCERFL